MSWTVTLSRKSDKQKSKLPQQVQSALLYLVHEIARCGLGPKRHHCHIKKGKPTFVAVWEELDGEIRLVEITYVGTHEKAPY
jgi:hypothetical protein